MELPALITRLRKAIHAAIRVPRARPARLVPVWALMVVLFPAARSGAQPAPYPPAFYRLKTESEKAAYLRKVIGDSVHAEAYTNVPAWTHAALGLVPPAQEDTLTPVLLQFLGDAYETSQPDSAAIYYRKSLRAYRKVPSLKKLYLQQSLVYAYMALGVKDSLRQYAQQLEETLGTLPDTSHNKLVGTNTLAAAYNELNQYPLTIKHYRFVIQQALSLKDTATLRNALVNTGAVYNQMEDNRMAIYYTLQALPYLSNDPYDRMTVYANLSGYYQNASVIDSAKYFVMKAERLAAASRDELAINAIRLRTAAVLMLEHKWTAAESLLQKSLVYFEQQEPGVELVNCLLVYASLDTTMHRYKQAETHLLALYKATQNLPQVYRSECLRQLIPVNEYLGDYRDAFLYQKEFMSIMDTIKSVEVQDKLAELQTEYQTYKREEQINLLQKDGVIKDLRLHAALRNKTLFIVVIFVLMAAFAIVLYIRHLRNKTSMRHMKAELEMKSLRSQMNPHFIFNSLNSIQKYIWENRQEDAAEYLTKFARLIRLVLENSLHESVQLAEELDALRLYIEMEHRRNNQQFDYSITIADDVDVVRIQIPPLLLQPYVENAIWHGLSQKEGRGKLSIAIAKKGAALICSIEDDGIGRKRAAEIRAASPQKTSLAMNISSQRIAWLQRDTGAATSVSIQDHFSGNIATGTSVLLTLPLISAS